MRLLLIAFGSRGDVQPILALGKGLKSAGYAVTIAAGTNFKTWIESSGFDYAPMVVDIHAMMNSESGKAWIEESSDSSLKEARNMRRMLFDFAEDMTANLIDICKDADVLVSGLPTLGLVEAIAEKTGKPHINILLAPLTPGSQGDSTMVPYVPKTNIFLNRYAGYIGVYFMWWIFGITTNQFRQQLGLAPLNYREFLKRWTAMPVVYGVSPTVMPRSREWGENIHVTGFWYWDEGNQWTPPQPLCDFLKTGEKPVYIGFGSMANKDPQGTIQTMVGALEKAGARGMIYSGWAGFHAENLPKSVYLLDGAPHDWLFPQMQAVVHHGGAGTTGAALRAGIPNTIVAHMGDQPYWGRRVHEMGVGAKMIRRHNLSTDRLAKAIEHMTRDHRIKQRAAEIGQRIRQEDGVARAVEAFDKILHL